MSANGSLLQSDGGFYLFFPALFDYQVVLIQCVLLNLEYQESLRLRSTFSVTRSMYSIAALKRKLDRFRFCFHKISSNVPRISSFENPRLSGIAAAEKCKAGMVKFALDKHYIHSSVFCRQPDCPAHDKTLKINIPVILPPSNCLDKPALECIDLCKA